MANNEKCFNCNDDANGNAQVPSTDGSVCVLDCSTGYYSSGTTC